MKKFKFILFSVLLCLAVTGCNSKPVDKLEQVKTAQELKVLVVDNSKPYSFYNQTLKEYQGVEVFIAQQVANDIGVKLTTVPVSKAELVKSLSKGDFALGRIANYESLRSEYTVSNPYAQGKLFVATPRGVFFPTIGAFDEKAVGISDQLSEPAKITVNGAKNAKVKPYSDIESATKALLDKSAAGYFCYEEQALSMLNNPDIQVQELINNEPENYVAIADKNSATLMAQINKTIARLLEDGSITTTYKQFLES